MPPKMEMWAVDTIHYRGFKAKEEEYSKRQLE